MTHPIVRSLQPTTFREFNSRFPCHYRLRQAARNGAIQVLSLAKVFRYSRGWIGFPYYHHVFDDERKGFERQLNFMRRYGDFIGFDDAVSSLISRDRIEGQYFCLSFDDGFKNCATNALPILANRDVPCAFFIPVNYIGTSLNKFPNNLGIPFPMEFVNWDDCRQFIHKGMVIGSHTCSHKKLSALRPQEVEKELHDSKRTIERELSRPCNHFCAPFGKPGLHFDPSRDPAIARELGYISFSTTQFGMMRQDSSPYSILRSRLVAAWGEYQIRHFFML